MSGNPFDDEVEGGTATKETNFFEAGAPTCKFTNVGDIHHGTIIKFEESQQRDINTGELKFWPDGNKCEMLIITIATDERSDQIDDDNGDRRLYVSRPSGMYAAISAAIKASGHKFVVGGKLAVKYVKNGIPKTKGFSPPKEYSAKYAPPGATAASPAASVDPTAGATSSLSPVKAAQMLAYTTFQTVHRGEADLLAQFKKAVQSYFGERDRDSIPVPAWTKFVMDNFQKPFVENPIESEPIYTDADIPF